jgi:rhodanese-related sulfurtransferase
VGRFRSETFSARGIEFSGDRARALWNYLTALPGKKGFVDPGWLWSPYLLNCKSALVNECRILDLRDPAQYHLNHVPNAVSVFQGTTDNDQTLPQQRIQKVFKETGIRKNTQIVLYDSGSSLEATWFWWNLTQAGHPYVAVLDGGWKNWTTSGFPVSDDIPNIEPSDYRIKKGEDDEPLELDGMPIVPAEWNWRDASGLDGLKNAETMNQMLQDSGLHGPGVYLFNGSLKEAAQLTFILKLLGREARIRRQANRQFSIILQDQR